MRCPYCGDAETRPGFFKTITPRPKACVRCTPLLKPLFTSGPGAFSEKPIRQNRGDLRRKLLESDNLHFIVFLDESERIAGFEFTDRDDFHSLQWKRGAPAGYYAVRETGRLFAKHERLLRNGPAPVERWLERFDAESANLHPDIARTLREGLASTRR